MLLRYALPLALLASACSTPPAAQTVDLVNPFPHLTFSSPVELMDAGDGTGLLYVAQQGGLIRVFENDEATKNSWPDSAKR